MLIKCDYCGKEINRKPSRIAVRKINCCSKECYSKIRGSRMVHCDYCHKKIRKGKRYLEKYRYYYCNQICYSNYRKEINKVQCSNCGKNNYRSKRDRDENKTNLFFCNMECRSEYFYKRDMVICCICKKEFYKSLTEQKRYPNHCCSILCRSEYNNERIKINCKTCDKILYKPISLIENKNNIFCSKKCHDEFQNQKIQVKCEKCGKKIYKSPIYIKRNKYHFCSTVCFSKYRFKESFVESQFEKMIKKLKIKYDRNNREVVGPLELDFYFPDINFAVEINGPTHYKPIYGEKNLNNQQKRDKRKRKKCRELGIKLRAVKPGDCKYNTFLPRYKRVIWEIKKLIKEKDFGF